MANPLITLNGLDDAKGVQSAYSGFKMGEDISQAPLRNSLLDAQVQGAELSNQNMRQQMSRADAEFMLKDAAIDAMRIKELAQVDPMRAQVAIADRIKKIVDRGGDPSDTIGVRELLTSGNTDAFNAELDAVISGAQQAGLVAGQVPSELKVGRFRELKLPDGSTATLDTATNQVTEVARAPSVDLSVVPEDMRASVANQPRDIQQKIVEQFSAPANQNKKAEQQQQQAKANEVATKTRNLVDELLGDEDALRRVVGAVDEFIPTFRDSSRDAEAALDDLKNLLTVENLDLMSGVLSESDIKILKSVGASGLSGSDDRVISTLKKMQKALSGGGAGNIDDLVNKYAD